MFQLQKIGANREKACAFVITPFSVHHTIRMLCNTLGERIREEQHSDRRGERIPV